MPSAASPAELCAFAESLLAALPAPGTGETPSSADPWNEQAFEQRALELFELQFRYNQPYRQWCLARGVTPSQVRQWTQIPAVPTAAFADFEFSCLDAAARTAVFHSSGTTRSRPSRHFHNADSLRVYEEVLWWAFERALLAPDSGRDALELVILLPPPSQAPHSSLVHMCETIRRRLGRPEGVFEGRVDPSGRWQVDAGAVWKRLGQLAAAGRPALILSTAYVLVALLETVGRAYEPLLLPTGSRLMETGGYKGWTRELPPAELRRLLEQRWGLPDSAIVSEYGMCELSSQAYDTRYRPGVGDSRDKAGPEVEPRLRMRRRFQFPPWVRWQVVDPETGAECPEGAVGLLRIFDLANVFSVLAVQTEDLAVRVGPGFQLRGRAAGAVPRGCSLMAADEPARSTVAQPRTP